MTQTAVEWLQEKFKNNEFDDALYKAFSQKWFEQAIEMEITQTQDACFEALKNEIVSVYEISDREIKEQALKMSYSDLIISIDSFIAGAKWCREQLK